MSSGCSRPVDRWRITAILLSGGYSRSRSTEIRPAVRIGSKHWNWGDWCDQNVGGFCWFS